MTAKGRYRDDFAAPPLPAPAPSPVGARRLEVEHQGRRHTVEIDPGAFACRRLVCELAGAASSMHHATGLSWGALRRLAASAKSLATYVDESAPDPGAVRCQTLTVDALEGWQSSLRRRYPASSDMPGERATGAFRLLRWLDEHSEVPVAAAVAARVRAPVTYPRPRAGCVDEFSAAERSAIEDTARRDVERLKRNLAFVRGEESPLAELLAAARAGQLTPAWAAERFGPRWETLPEAVHVLIERRDPAPVDLDETGRADVTRVFDLHAGGVPPGEIAAMLNAAGRPARRGGPWTVHKVRGVLGRRYAGVPASLDGMTWWQTTRERTAPNWLPEALVEAVHRLVCPHELDLVGVVVLLCLRTGLPPECIKDLTIRCVTGADSRFATIEYVKRRGPGRSSVRVPNPGEFAPARLVSLVLAATAETRGLLSGDLVAERLFVCGTRRYGTLRARAADFQGAFERWCRAHDLAVSPPYDLRRLRKTRKVARALALRGSIADIADDHTTQVACRHYLQTTTLQVLSADVIRGVQQRIVEEMAAGPVVVPPEVEATLTTEAQGAAAGLGLPVARALAEGRLDVGLASCRDVKSSPFAPAGELCPAAFGGSCLWCPNAIITERSLPALLLFCDHIEDQRRELPPTTWDERWGPTVRRIRDQVLPAFPEAAVAGARAAADADPALLHLPPAMTARSRR